MTNLKLKNIYICENVIVALNGQLSLINLTSEITAKAFPAVHPKLTIVVSLSGDTGKYTEQVELITIKDYKTIATITSQVNIEGPGGNNLIASFVNLVFQQDDKCWVKVTVDGRIITNQDEHFFEIKRTV